MGNAIRPNYQMRHLTTDDLEQYNQLLRYAFQVTEQELAETGWRDDRRSSSPSSRCWSGPTCWAASTGIT